MTTAVVPAAVPAASAPAAPGSGTAARTSPQFDSTLTLALALRGAPGAYALLLGSGLSSAAGIPTGWGVVLDLLRQLAPPGTDDAPGGLEAWYRATHGGEPDYSTLLEAVAATPAERRERLRRYFEPTAQEREDGRKLPTRAHRAIATLAAGGYVRVIVTTNFDQLLETALRDAGVTPAVISTPDAVAGAMPVQHERATVVKLHGDYTDVRIKNTPGELAGYDPAVDALLDRVFDEYGLVVCGWSAAWDDALRAAITRAPNRRFTTFWATRGPLGAEAARLAELRRATVIDIEEADAFFEAVAARVAALEELDRPPPVTTAVAVASLKRYLPRPEDRIRLDDLVMTEVNAARARADRATPADRAVSNAEFAAMVRQVEAGAETLAALMAAGAYWGEPAHRALWRKALERAAAPVAGESSGALPPIMRRYVAQIAWYAAGVAAAGAGQDDTLAALLLDPRVDLVGEGRVAPSVGLHVYRVIENDWAKGLPGHQRQKTPLSERLLALLRPAVAPLVADEDAYVAAFERFEVLVALAYLHEQRNDPGGAAVTVWSPLGRAAWRRARAFSGEASVLDRLGREIAQAGADSVLIRRGFFDGSRDRLTAAHAAMVEQANRTSF